MDKKQWEDPDIMSKIADRFVRYISYDTQSQEYTGTIPSTEKQLVLAEVLKDELEGLGLSDVRMTEHGYVYATIPGNIDHDCPVIGFLSHMDTSPDCSGADIKPRFIYNYNGKAITLNEELGIVTDPEEFPDLKRYIGKDLIVTDGTTLLGGDDKAGIAEIMTMAELLMNSPETKHGTVKIAFTPDEEIGHGVDFFDIEGWGADAAYTVDGGGFGELEYETFNAAALTVTVHGRNIHPGSAKNKMKNAILIGMEFESMLPTGQKPQYTEGYEGFFHLNDISGNVEEARLNYLIRDHDRDKFEDKKELAVKAVEYLNLKYGKGTVEAEITDTYYNMAEKIRPNMYLVDTAAAVIQELGVRPVIEPIRGGTDGALLSFKGLPCPNLCTGDNNPHGRNEFVCIQDMHNTVRLLMGIVERFGAMNKI